MKKRTLGNTQRVLPAIGLGCMGLSEFYGPPTDRGAAIKLLHEAIGLSEAAGDTIRRAAKIHPISAVQSEYSIFSRDIEASVIPACIEIRATLVAYSPLGRGMLSGRFKEEALGEGDFRSVTPRFQREA